VCAARPTSVWYSRVRVRLLCLLLCRALPLLLLLLLLLYPISACRGRERRRMTIRAQPAPARHSCGPCRLQAGIMLMHCLLNRHCHNARACLTSYADNLLYIIRYTPTAPSCVYTQTAQLQRQSEHVSSGIRLFRTIHFSLLLACVEHGLL
jgi:hypothetical protein